MSSNDRSYWRKTKSGRIVYDRKRHSFNSGAILRIVQKYTNDVERDELRELPTASHIRALKFHIDELYGQVWDIFEPITEAEADGLKQTFRSFNDQMVGLIAAFIGSKISLVSPEAGFWAEQGLEIVGKLINRGMEYIMTGSTGD